MSFALSAGVTGLQAHQKMLDIAGNNLANVNTPAFKSSRITFSELLSETIKKASAPTTTGVGGTNPQQMGSGVGIAGISPNMAQGNIVNTGNPLDLAMEGEGYFVLSDGSQNFYTRAGAFGVDANSNLVDPATGYLVQRIGDLGVATGFQKGDDTNVHVPYDITLEANATSTIAVQGNLSSDAEFATTQTQKLASNLKYTTGSGTTVTAAVVTDEIDQLTQFTGGGESDGQLSAGESGTITFSGYKPDGTALADASPAVKLTMDVGPTTKLSDVLAHLNTDDGASNEIQTVSISYTTIPTGGDFTLDFNSATTPATIVLTDSAAQIKTKLEAMDTLSTGDVSVTLVGGSGLPADDIVIEFTGTKAATDVVLIEIDTSGLTGGTGVSGAVDETNTGKAVQGVLGGDAAATLVNGKIVITDAADGYSETDLTMSYAAAGSESHLLEVPAYFELSTVGGEEVKDINITVYDSFGGKYTLSGAFVRTSAANKWDMVLTSISGDIDEITMDNRRIKDIEFDADDGSYKGLAGSTPDTPEFKVTFEDMSEQTIAITMGTVGEFNGLTQLAGNSTAVARNQDGYEKGTLSTVSVNNEGIVIGAFTNGIKKDIAIIQVAFFQNPGALESVGGGYFSGSANSGTAVATQAMSAGAGSVHGGALEKSNADVATEFVNMIQAQNGFQANARTIRVANDILRELTNLIR